jgi:hypothetical protein
VGGPLSQLREGELRRDIASYSFVRNGVVIFCLCSTVACNVPVVYL